MKENGVIIELNQEKEVNKEVKMSDELCSKQTEDIIKMKRREKGKQLFLFSQTFYPSIPEQQNLLMSR